MKSYYEVCSKHYLIYPELHELIVSGNLPNNSKHIFNKIISLEKPGVYLVTFRTIMFENKPVLIYNFLFYYEFFSDLFLMFLILRIRFKDSLTYGNWGNIFTLIDSSLNNHKKGLINCLMNEPNLFNEYLYLEINNNSSSSFGTKWLDFLKLFVYMKNINEMSDLLDLAYKGGENNIPFLNELTTLNVTETALTDTNTNILKTKLLNNCIFIVKDLEEFKKIVQEKHPNVNQGNQKWRGQISTMSNLLVCVDQDFRSSLYQYNQYHLNKKNLSPNLALTIRNFSFDNIHRNLGNVKW